MLGQLLRRRPHYYPPLSQLRDGKSTQVRSLRRRRARGSGRYIIVNFLGGDAGFGALLSVNPKIRE